jgi:hypothetical protein
MQIESLIDNLDGHDYDHWTAISTGGGEWFPPYEWLEETEALALASLLRSFTATAGDAWFMLWDGYGDVAAPTEGMARGMIHPNRAVQLPPEMAGQTAAFRHYLVFRAPLDGLTEWFRWREGGPNYWWPNDRSWVLVTEIDGFSTYVGGASECVDAVLTSPLLEALPSILNHRFDLWGDRVNGMPDVAS